MFLRAKKVAKFRSEYSRSFSENATGTGEAGDLRKGLEKAGEARLSLNGGAEPSVAEIAKGVRLPEKTVRNSLTF